MPNRLIEKSRVRFTAALLAVASMTGAFDLFADTPELVFTKVAGISGIVDIANAGDGSERLFLVRQSGVIYILKNGELLDTPFLDMRARVETGQHEQGLLSMAFAPDFATSGYFYVWFTRIGGDTALARYRISDDPDIADPDSFQIVLIQPQPLGNHNGGRLQFGPDGMLYLGLGDGGGANDPDENAQNPDTLLGKLIRIDVDPVHGSYAVPGDNPFVTDSSTRNEIWALGLRNPWKISFDQATGDLYIADVGQNQREEVNYQPASSAGGENYGWDIKEGTRCLGGAACTQQEFTDPVTEYTHDDGCSITGGEVYRGEHYPNLAGVYLYGDWCTGNIWGLSRDDGAWSNMLLADTGFSPTTFGQDEDGTIYLASNDGIYQISDGKPVSGFRINAGLNDAWYNPDTDGQGLLIAVFEDAGVMFAAWFTYDTERPPDDVTAILGEPGHRWLTAQGTYSGDTATLEIYVSSGGIFDSGTPPVEREIIGTMTITWTGCNEGIARYDIPSLGLMGSIPIQRVAPDNVALCEAMR